MNPTVTIKGVLVMTVVTLVVLAIVMRVAPVRKIVTGIA